MKRLLTIGICVLALLCCCQKTTKQADAPQQPVNVDQRVKEIYDDVAKTYGNDVMPNNLKNLAPLYCSKDWNAMLAAIAEADKDKDMGFFDADYWVMGQDYQDISADNIKVERQTEQEATAMLDLHNCGNVIQVRLSLVLEDGQWMIDNFEDVSNGLNWKQAMKEYLEEQ